MLRLVVHRTDGAVWTAALGALLRSLSLDVRNRVVDDHSGGFVPRLEDEDTGRWMAILVGSDPPETAAEAVARGASAVVSAGMSVEELDHAIDDVFSTSDARGPRRAPVEDPPPTALIPAGLTVRELEVLALVARGHTNAEVAAKLFISTNTVRTHLRSLCIKLEVSGRAKLAVTAWKLRLLE